MLNQTRATDNGLLNGAKWLPGWTGRTGRPSRYLRRRRLLALLTIILSPRAPPFSCPSRGPIYVYKGGKKRRLEDSIAEESTSNWEIV